MYRFDANGLFMATPAGRAVRCIFLASVRVCLTRHVSRAAKKDAASIPVAAGRSNFEMQQYNYHQLFSNL